MYLQDISALVTKVCTPPGGRWMAPLGVIIVSCPPGPLRPSAAPVVTIAFTTGRWSSDGNDLDDLGVH